MVPDAYGREELTGERFWGLTKGGLLAKMKPLESTLVYSRNRIKWERRLDEKKKSRKEENKNCEIIGGRNLKSKQEEPRDWS